MKKFIQNGKNNNSSPHSNLPSTAVTTATAKTTKAPYRNTAHPTMDTTTTTQQQQPPPPPPTTTNTTTTTTVVVTAIAVAVARKKKRVCRFPGCTNLIKSQGHCQRHGAIVKLCKVREMQKCRNDLCVPFCPMFCSIFLAAVVFLSLTYCRCRCWCCVLALFLSQ